MCHYMLPGRSRKHNGQLSGRYADEAFDLFLLELKKFVTRPREYELKLFGGGNMFIRDGARLWGLERNNIAMRNVTAARDLSRRHGFDIKAEDLGGHGYRQVLFDLDNGRAWCRHHGDGARVIFANSKAGGS